MTENYQRAEVLVCALPYIKQYSGKIVVVKYGGNAMINDELKKAVMGDVALLTLIGVKVVLVHGGGPELTETMSKMNLPTRFVNGLRVTDRETAQVALMVLAGGCSIRKGRNGKDWIYDLDYFGRRRCFAAGLVRRTLQRRQACRFESRRGRGGDRRGAGKAL